MIRTKFFKHKSSQGQKKNHEVLCSKIERDVKAITDVSVVDVAKALQDEGIEITTMPKTSKLEKTLKNVKRMPNVKKR